MEVLDIMGMNYTFKLKRIKEYLKAPESPWCVIPQNIFEKMGGPQIILQCKYDYYLEQCIHNTKE